MLLGYLLLLSLVLSAGTVWVMILGTLMVTAIRTDNSPEPSFPVIALLPILLLMLCISSLAFLLRRRLLRSNRQDAH